MSPLDNPEFYEKIYVGAMKMCLYIKQIKNEEFIKKINSYHKCY